LSQESPGMLVPPRPNLGPEPWSEVPPSWQLPLAMGLAAATLLLAAFWLLIRRRARRRQEIPSRIQPAIADDSPSAQLLNLAGQVRETLATRFGPSIRARTTEELSADPAVKEALGDDHFESLIRLLATADQWKFASPPGNGQTESLLDELSRWSAWEGVFRGTGRA